MVKKVCTTLVAIAAAVLCAVPAFAQSDSWNQVFNGQGRFAVLPQFNGDAVLDRETGLAWQRTLTTDAAVAFEVASRYCIELVAGNRRGWRLPTIVELQSVTDPTASAPTLTPGHPFENIDIVRNYWSSTTTADFPGFAWGLNLGTAQVVRIEKCAAGSGCGSPKVPPAVWCVRGGAGPDVQ